MDAGDSSQLALFGHRPRVAPAKPTSTSAAAGSSLPRSIRLGTSSWSFSGWEGLVFDRSYPSSMLAREGLPAYAAHPLLRTVGVDRTFYAPVPQALFREYADQVPEEFRFVVKAHDACTLSIFPNHARYGSRAAQPNSLFLDAAYATDHAVRPFVEGLGARGGALVFQFSPQPLDRIGTPAVFADRLSRFLAALPAGPLYGVELRVPLLLTRAYASALESASACHVLSVHPSMPALRTQASTVGAGALPHVLVRWMLRPGMRYDDAKARYRPFNRVVDPDSASLEAIAELAVRGTRTGRDVYIIVNNKAEGSAPGSIERAASRIAMLLSGDPKETE